MSTFALISSNNNFLLSFLAVWVVWVVGHGTADNDRWNRVPKSGCWPPPEAITMPSLDCCVRSLDWPGAG